MLPRLGHLCLLVCSLNACVTPVSQIRVGKVALRARYAQLPSGARIVVEEAPGTGTVAVSMLVGAGSAQDPAGKEGLAHLAEHLSFRSKPAGKITQAQAYELLGAGSFDGQTLFDDTRFSLAGQARLTPQLVALAAQQLAFPAANIDPRVFEVERGVVLSEYAEHSERPFDFQTLAALQKVLFPEHHPYSRPHGGTQETIAALTLADVQGWTQAHYLPSNTTLVIAGDFDTATMEPQILAALPDSWKAPPPAGTTPRPLTNEPLTPPEPPDPNAKLPVVQAEVHRSELLLAWSLPPEWAFALPPSRMGGNVAALLNPRHADEVSDALPARCGVEPFGSFAVLLCNVPLMTGLRPEQTLAILAKRLERLDVPASERTPTELQNAPLYLHQLVRLEDLPTRANERAERFHYTGDALSLEKQIETIRHPDRPTGTLLRQYLTRERMRAVLVEPRAVNPAAVARAPAGEQRLEVHVSPEAVRTEAEGPNLTGMQRFTLENGLQVLVVPRPAMPLATVELALPGGTARGELGAALLAQMYAPYEAQALQLGGETQVEQRADVTLVRFIGGNRNVEQLLEYAGVWLTDRRGSQAIEDSREYFDQTLQSLDASAKGHENDPFIDQVYRGSRLSPVVPHDVLSKMNVEIADQWRAAAFQPARSALIITGDIDPSRMRKLAEKTLGDWSATGPAPAPLPEVSFAPKPTQVMVNDHAGSGRVTLGLGCLMPAVRGPYALAPEVLERLLRARLDRAWRTELGVAHQVTASTNVDPQAAALFIEAEIDPSALTAVLRTLKTEWDQLEVPEEDVAMARWTTARERSIAGARGPAVADYFGVSALRTQDLLGASELEHHLSDLPRELVQKEFDVCKGTTVLRLDGDPDLIHRALHAMNP